MFWLFSIWYTSTLHEIELNHPGFRCVYMVPQDGLVNLSFSLMTQKQYMELNLGSIAINSFYAVCLGTATVSIGSWDSVAKRETKSSIEFNKTCCRISKLLYPAVESRKIQALLVYFDNNTVRSLTEHCTSSSFADKFGLAHQNYCRSCHDFKKAKSVYKCPKLQNRRYQFFRGQNMPLKKLYGLIRCLRCGS